MIIFLLLGTTAATAKSIRGGIPPEEIGDEKEGKEQVILPFNPPNSKDLIIIIILIFLVIFLLSCFGAQFDTPFGRFTFHLNRPPRLMHVLPFRAAGAPQPQPERGFFGRIFFG